MSLRFGLEVSRSVALSPDVSMAAGAITIRVIEVLSCPACSHAGQSIGLSRLEWFLCDQGFPGTSNSCCGQPRGRIVRRWTNRNSALSKLRSEGIASSNVVVFWTATLGGSTAAITKAARYLATRIRILGMVLDPHMICYCCRGPMSLELPGGGVRTENTACDFVKHLPAISGPKSPRLLG
jgi:hypothetical protein